MLSFLFFLTILNMDKVKINSITGNVINVTFTFDDARVAPININFDDKNLTDGDILAEELYTYGQTYKSEIISKLPSDAVLGSIGMEFGYENGVIVPVIPETPVIEETPVTPVVPEEVPTEETPI